MSSRRATSAIVAPAEDAAQCLDAVGPDAAGLGALVADPPVERLNDLEHGDVVRRAGKPEATLGTTLGDQQAVTPQGAEQLLEELNGNAAPLGDDRDRDRPIGMP